MSASHAVARPGSCWSVPGRTTTAGPAAARSVTNTAWLLPTVFRAVWRCDGLVAALRETNRATTAGSVPVDGVRVGDVASLGPEGVVEAVARLSAGAS